MTDLIRDLILRWRDDPAGTYQSWFLWDERLKKFRSIRRGLQQVVAEIVDDTFGVAYRGSSLETVVHLIANQRDIFKRVNHAFSIHKIYEEKILTKNNLFITIYFYIFNVKKITHNIFYFNSS